MNNTTLYGSGGTMLDSYSYSYDEANERTELDCNSENIAQYAYDKIGEVVGDSATEENGGTTRLNEQLGYAFDPAGNLAYRTNNALLQNFRVNVDNELTSNTNTGTLTVVNEGGTQRGEPRVTSRHLTIGIRFFSSRPSELR
jgi:hypothetical protein